MEQKFVGKCIISSIIFQEESMNESMGSFALMRDETQTWKDVQKLLSDKEFNINTIDGDGADYEIRPSTQMTKAELYEALKRLLIDFAEENNLTLIEDNYEVGVGSQNILTLRS